MIKSIATFRHFRVLGFAAGAVAIAIGAVWITASAAGLNIGLRSPSQSLPASDATAAEATVVAAASQDPVVAVNRSDNSPLAAPARGRTTSVVRVGDRFDDPWMRAMIVSPSAQNFMRTTLYGVPDYRNLRPHMHKPVATVAMTFSDDPHIGVTSDKFLGSAVVFISIATFNARTAALQ